MKHFLWLKTIDQKIKIRSKFDYFKLFYYFKVFIKEVLANLARFRGKANRLDLDPTRIFFYEVKVINLFEVDSIIGIRCKNPKGVKTPWGNFSRV